MLDVLVIETPNLGDRSYVVHDGTSAAVVDPQRDLDRVLGLVDDHGLRVAVVAETHIHNDYLTGGLALARETGAEYLVGADDEVRFERTPVRDGDVREVGGFTLRAVHTPGHTPNHLAYAALVGGEVCGVFTGGSLLFGSTGRTDLVDPRLTDELAHAQWRSARRLAAELPGGAQVWPTHGFGSFCSASQSGDTATESTIDDERGGNPALTRDEASYVAETLAGLDVYPAYYVRMAPANLAGPAPADLTPPPTADATGLARRIDAGEWVLDLRPRTDFAADHVPGMLSFEGSGNVATYVGWLVPWGTPITLCGATEQDVALVQRELARIGVDRPAAMAVGAPQTWSTGPLTSYRSVRFADLAADPGAVVLDVRRAGEWRDGHIEGAVHVPLHELEARLDELPAGELWVHCASGFRAGIAASLLDRAGRKVVHVDGDFAEAEAAGLRIVQDSCGGLMPD